jgi:ankyrin repeat protein
MQIGLDLEQKDYQGQTALHIAASTRSLEDVEELLEMGANVNTPDEKVSTPLNLAIMN